MIHRNTSADPKISEKSNKKKYINIRYCLPLRSSCFMFHVYLLRYG